MEVTNQESAENLKNIINHTQEFIEEMQQEYLAQSMRTCIDYFEGKADITAVRKIEMDFNRVCESSCAEQDVVISALERFRGIHDGEWSMEKMPSDVHTWNMLYELSKGDKRLFISVETRLTTSLMVYD